MSKITEILVEFRSVIMFLAFLALFALGVLVLIWRDKWRERRMK